MWSDSLHSHFAVLWEEKEVCVVSAIWERRAMPNGLGRCVAAFLVGLDVSNDDVRHLRLGATTSATARAGFFLIPVGTFRGEVVRFST